MKDLAYKKEKTLEVLDEGESNGFHYVITSIGWYPVAYVEKKKNYTDHEIYSISVRGSLGGFTKTNEKLSWNPTDIREYLSWDYFKSTDYCGVFKEKVNKLFNTKKTTTKKIKKDIDEVTAQLKLLEE